MMRYTCPACVRGMHDLCAGKQSPPPGMLGGSECDCDGHCDKRKPDPNQLDRIDCVFDALNQAKVEC